MRSTVHHARIRTLAWALGAALLLAAAPQHLQAQGTPAQMEFVRAELAKRGLSEMEARTRLLQNGIDLDRIPLNELPQYQGRITTILDQLVAEKRTAGTASGTPTGMLPAAPLDTTKRQATTPTEAAADTAALRRRRTPPLPDTLPAIYGHDLFTDQSLAVFRTTDGARAPDSYVLGAGDQIRVSIFGTSQADLLAEINPEGFVQFSGVPKLFLRGLTLAQARPLLRSRLAGFYSFNADQYAVTLQTARTVTVNVFGESELRGSFTVSALNTALNALAAAGGPTPIGSVREIQVVRGAQRRKLDLYAFLDDPKLLFEFDLQHNDVVFVPVAKTLVTVEGAVKRPLRYELLQGEDLAQLIRFAGGVNFNANPDNVQVQRVEGDSVVLRDFRLREVLDGKTKVALQDGDVIRVRTAGRPLEQVVEVEGAVFYEGRYDLATGRTLAQVLTKAQPKQDAAAVAYVRRSNPLNREEISYIRIDLTRDQGFELQPLDRVTLFSRSVFTEIGELSVSGAVQRGTVRMTYDPGLTVRDLLTMAGGFTLNSALNRVDLFRLQVDPVKGTTFDRLELAVDSSYAVVKGPANFRLQPFDQLIVREIPLFAVERNVQLSGQVLFPGPYALSSSLTHLSDVVREAGGLTDLADQQFAVLTREGVGPIGVDLRRALAEAHTEGADPILLPGDVIQVDRRQNTIRIRLRGTRVGELASGGLTDQSESSTSSFIYQGPRSARWYIEEFAGGFAQEADRMSVTVTDPSGRVRGTTRRLLVFKAYPTVLPGSTITLRDKFQRDAALGQEKKVDWDAVSARTTQFLTTVITLLVLSRQL